MKARAELQVARQGMADREIKLGPGGIRDIEFTVQLLQLVHGHADPGLRSPTTLTALEEMGVAGYIDPEDAARLADAYRLLRTVEHRLQLVDEQQVHAMPTDPDAVDHLARVLGYRDTTARHRGRAARRRAPPAAARRAIDPAARLLPAAARSVRRRPRARSAPRPRSTRLKAFGFTDAKRTQAAVRELTRGLNRSSRLMQQMLPLHARLAVGLARPRPRAAPAAQPADRPPSGRPRWSRRSASHPNRPSASASCSAPAA